MKQNFIKINPDYPNADFIVNAELCVVSDQDVPSGNGGINREGYSYGQLRKQPIIDELLRGITTKELVNIARVCNTRNERDGFQMFKINGEYCFWGLRVGPVVATPNVEQMRKILANQTKTSLAVEEKSVTLEMIRKVTYDLLRNQIARECGITVNEAASAIGNQLDCAPHEDPSGFIFMVPNWAHNWFRHDGYVSKMVKELNK